MKSTSTDIYRFGDLLALAREHWVRQMAHRLADAGYPDYRRSDAMLLRLLLRGPRSIGEIGSTLGISRQAARKLVAGLERRGHASADRDDHDARQIDVTLTARGRSFADAIIATIDALNRELADNVSPERLQAADAVLRAIIAGRSLDRSADPPSRGS